MQNVTKAEQDQFIKAIRVYERLMRDELHARKRNYFTLEKTIRALRRDISPLT